jgi:hypothetical protein
MDHIEYWETVATKYAEARETYRVAFAVAYLASNQNTGDARKYEADAATSELRLARDKAEIVASAAWQSLLTERGKIEGSANPQLKLGTDT